MYPYIRTPYGDIPTFVLFILIGILSMFFYIRFLLKQNTNEELYIFPKIIFSGILGYFFAGFADSVFKYFETGVFKISGITFYGGLLSVVFILYIQLSIHKDTSYKIGEWFDLLTKPFIVFHFWGRIGCFFAGCCYGKSTDNWIGFYFPDNSELGIFHNSLKCYPTQLFEAFGLLLILFILNFSKRKFQIYMISYAILRFFIEFFRGDDRGYLSEFFSPSQIISLVIIFTIILFHIVSSIKNKPKN